MKTRYFSRRLPLNLQIFVSCKPLVCEKRLNIFSFYIFRGDPIHQSAIAKGGDPFHLNYKGRAKFTKVQRGKPSHLKCKGGRDPIHQSGDPIDYCKMASRF